tara:strand:- start:137 stop:1021 length:885 start_codon:yes stop_codon:yes gene_type:complete
MEYILGVLTSPGPNLFTFGPLTLRWYGLLIGLSILIGLNISNQLAKSRDINKAIINDLTPILVLTAIIGARIYYVAFEWRNYSGLNFWSSINLMGLKISIPSAIEIWGGGIAIHGALISGIITVGLFCKIKKQSFLNVLDVLVPSVALGQAIGRWGNFFNNEAFGLPTNLPWKLYIPYIYRPEIFSNKTFFHPTFLYESLWNIGVFLLLILIFKRSNKGRMELPYGAISFIYLISYSLGRLWIEGFRIDPLCLNALPPFCSGGIRIAQLISILFILIGTLGLILIYKKPKNIYL